MRRTDKTDEFDFRPGGPHIEQTEPGKFRTVPQPALTHTIIGFSGPPRAGKDSAARFAAQWLEHHHYYPWFFSRLSQPLKDAAIALLPNKDFATETLKDEREPSIGLSYRQVQIELFRWGAIRFGEDWLGRHMLERLNYLKAPSFILCPDFGRRSEVEVLIKAGHTVHCLRLERPGTTFSGDPRQPHCTVSKNGFGDIYHNNSSFESLEDAVARFLSKALSDPPAAA